MLFKYSFRTAQ